MKKCEKKCKTFPFYFGNVQAFGNGLARTFIKKGKKLKTIGVLLNREALCELPTTISPCKNAYEISLTLPEEALCFGFKFVKVRFSPHPQRLLSGSTVVQPLLGFDFYLKSSFEQQSISPRFNTSNCTNVNQQEAGVLPISPDFLPPGYTLPFSNLETIQIEEGVGLTAFQPSSIPKYTEHITQQEAIENGNNFTDLLAFGYFNQQINSFRSIVGLNAFAKSCSDAKVKKIYSPQIIPKELDCFPVSYEYGFSKALNGYYFVFHFE